MRNLLGVGNWGTAGDVRNQKGCLKENRSAELFVFITNSKNVLIQLDTVTTQNAGMVLQI
jgi:hypothetical protein